jgi:Uma2 family endonuclease
MVTREQRYTLDDLRRIEALPENAGKTFELIDGDLYEVPTPNAIHNFIVSQILYALMNFVFPRQLGFVLGDQTAYSLPNGDELIPDASFVSFQRQPSLPERFSIAPDIAVEVISPSNRERDVTAKVESYLEPGTVLVWLFYPISRVVEVWRRAEDGAPKFRKLTEDSLLDGEDVLPGFSLAVRDVFPVEAP